jgi:hypothetical protein
MRRYKDLFWATIGEGGLILILATVGWVARQSLIFASLGPTVYELVEQPQARSARTYNIIVGHFIALGAGFLAVFVLNAWSAPNVVATGIVSPARLWAVTIASVITTFVTLLFKASQPAALSTALLISLGAMQTRRDAVIIGLGVVITAVIGEPVRRFRLEHTEHKPSN